MTHKLISIKPTETKIIGSWVLEDSKISADSNCERVNQLTENYLILIADDESNWETLYRDPVDGRFWERTYPQSELHGGGPPSLIIIEEGDANKKYQVELR